MTYLRATILGFVTISILVLILRWSNLSKYSEGAGRFTTSEACLDAFRDAKSAGNAAAYLRCLGEPLRSETRENYRDEQEMGLAIREEVKGVKSWGVKERPDSEAKKGTAIIEEVYASGVREFRLEMERAGEGWLIVAIESGKKRPASLPYGTVVGKEPEEKE